MNWNTGISPGLSKKLHQRAELAGKPLFPLPPSPNRWQAFRLHILRSVLVSHILTSDTFSFSVQFLCKTEAKPIFELHFSYT